MSTRYVNKYQQAEQNPANYMDLSHLMNNQPVMETSRGVIFSAPMTTAEVIQAFLKGRKERGQLVVSKLAKRMDISPGYVTMILSGERRYPMDYIDQTAEFFGWSVVQLIQQAEQEIKPAERKTADG